MAEILGLVHEEDGTLGISFPDFPGCVATGGSLDEVRRRGADALAFHIDGMIEDGIDVPEPRSFEAIRRDKELADDLKDALLVGISIEVPSKTERVNITIDKRLTEVG